MSIIKITSSIEKVLDGSLGNSAAIKNIFRSTSDGDASEFVSDYCLVDTWNLNATQAGSFSQDILSVLDNSVGSGQVTFIHIQCHKKVKVPNDKADPIRFEVELGGTSTGKLSQFQAANIEGFPHATVVVKNPEISGTDECVLSVVIGFNKA